MTTITLLAALLLDRIFGEPKRLHPLVGFGHLVFGIEKRLNFRPTAMIAGRLMGLLGVIILVVPPVILILLLPLSFGLELMLTLLLVTIAIGARSLAEHAKEVADALNSQDLEAARTKVGYIVSRDTTKMDETAVSRAAVESVLENGNDAIFAAIFWFAIAGLPAVVAYRLFNTLDAMWGYRTERFYHFGWAAARLDDLLNWIPARLTALSYALLGRTSNALRCWKLQASLCESPNAGPVMAAGAGALGCRLGGGAWYHGSWMERPQLGEGDVPKAIDIQRAISLIDRSIFLWLVMIMIIEVSLYA